MFDSIELKTTPAMGVFNFPPAKQKSKLKGNIYLINSDIDYSVGALMNYVNIRASLNVKERMSFFDMAVMAALIAVLGAILVALLYNIESLAASMETLQEVIKKRSVWIFVSSMVFLFCMGCIVFTSLHGAPALGNGEDLFEMLINKQNRYQYGLEGFIASALMLSCGFMIVAMVNVLRNKEHNNQNKLRDGFIIFVLFFVLYFLLIQMYTYKTPWHTVQSIFPPDNYIKGPISVDHGMTI